MPWFSYKTKLESSILHKFTKKNLLPVSTGDFYISLMG